jgi:hypothetical protein
VYTDFPWNGCSGVDDDHVYAVGSSSTLRGGHAVTMIGYGWAYNTCNPTGSSSCTAATGCVSGWVKYWLLQNSWGRNWGQGGYYKHRRGTNEARIESWAATAPSVDVNCNESNNYYGGKINYPTKWWAIKKAATKSVSKFEHMMHMLKELDHSFNAPGPKEPSEEVRSPGPSKSDGCKAAHWNKSASIGGFELVEDIQDLIR